MLALTFWSCLLQTGFLFLFFFFFPFVAAQGKTTKTTTTTAIALLDAHTNEIDIKILDDHQRNQPDGSLLLQDAVAHATFEDTLLKTGWGILDITTNPKYQDEQQAYAAGFLEGALTAQHIHTTAQNLVSIVYKGEQTMPKDVQDFMDEQEKWTRDQISKHASTDSFWRQISYIIKQFEGLEKGYRKKITNPLDHWAIQMLNAVGDMFDIIPTVRRKERKSIKDWLGLHPVEAEYRHGHMGHCSAIIKVLGDFSDLFVAHSSWYTFSNTNRIMKHYTLNFNDPSTVAKRVSFSSYPGFLNSLDDFYMMGSGLLMTQTTNGVLDQSVYDVVKPQSLLAWHRVRAASAMANSGKDYLEIMGKHFSGTYANMYMVIDMKLFKPHHPLPEGLLYVIEEMPGILVGSDQTETLKRGYFPSYNIPFDKRVYNRSGYVEMAKEKGLFWFYETNPRANIFRREQGNVKDLTSLKELMRFNNFKDDPYSVDYTTGLPNPMYAICSRGDLEANKSKAVADGCYDTKVTSFKHGALSGQAEILNGPTRSHDLPAFGWASKLFETDPHLGLPESYEFDFIPTEPKPFPFHQTGSSFSSLEP